MVSAESESVVFSLSVLSESVVFSVTRLVGVSPLLAMALRPLTPTHYQLILLRIVASDVKP